MNCLYKFAHLVKKKSNAHISRICSGKDNDKHKTVQDLVCESFDMDLKFVILPISLWFNGYGVRSYDDRRLLGKVRTSRVLFSSGDYSCSRIPLYIKLEPSGTLF
jgi:hypothetical protein